MKQKQFPQVVGLFNPDFMQLDVLRDLQCGNHGILDALYSNLYELAAKGCFPDLRFKSMPAISDVEFLDVQSRKHLRLTLSSLPLLYNRVDLIPQLEPLEHVIIRIYVRGERVDLCGSGRYCIVMPANIAFQDIEYAFLLIAPVHVISTPHERVSEVIYLFNGIEKRDLAGVRDRPLISRQGLTVENTACELSFWAESRVQSAMQQFQQLAVPQVCDDRVCVRNILDMYARFKFYGLQVRDLLAQRMDVPRRSVLQVSRIAIAAHVRAFVASKFSAVRVQLLEMPEKTCTVYFGENFLTVRAFKTHHLRRVANNLGCDAATFYYAIRRLPDLHVLEDNDELPPAVLLQRRPHSGFLQIMLSTVQQKPPQPVIADYSRPEPCRSEHGRENYSRTDHGKTDYSRAAPKPSRHGSEKSTTRTYSDFKKPTPKPCPKPCPQPYQQNLTIVAAIANFTSAITNPLFMCSNFPDIIMHFTQRIPTVKKCYLYQDGAKAVDVNLNALPLDLSIDFVMERRHIANTKLNSTLYARVPEQLFLVRWKNKYVCWTSEAFISNFIRKLRRFDAFFHREKEPDCAEFWQLPAADQERIAKLLRIE